MTNMESTSNKQSSQRGYVNEPVNIENSTHSTDCSLCGQTRDYYYIYILAERKQTLQTALMYQHNMRNAQ